MIKFFFALTLSEIGIGKLEIFVIWIVSILFPILFIIASKNLDAKGVFNWMMEKPNDWVGRKWSFVFKKYLKFNFWTLICIIHLQGNRISDNYFQGLEWYYY